MPYRPVQPAQYISQYDPAMEQVARDIMLMSQAKYEQSFNNLLKEQARQEDIFFLNPEDKKIAQQNFNTQRDEILSRYNNNYEAAAPELSKLIVKERGNPAYQMSQYQLERMKDFQKEYAQIGAENAIVVNDPREDLSIYKDGVLKSASDFNYKIFDKFQII